MRGRLVSGLLLLALPASAAPKASEAALAGFIPASAAVEVEVAWDPAVELVAEAAASTGSVDARKNRASAASEALGAADAPALREAAARALAPGAAATRLALELSGPPDFAPRGPLPHALVDELGGPARAAAAARSLAGFARAARFAETLPARRAALEAAAAAARREAAAGPDPSAVAAWLRESAPLRLRFLVSPALPPELGASRARLDARGLEAVEVRAGGGGAFGLDRPADSPAQRAALALLARHWPPGAGGGAEGLPPGCPAPWDACLRAHAALAAVLESLPPARAGALARGLERRSWPLLEAARAAWKPFAKDRTLSLADFAPRLREALLAAAPAAAAASGPAPRRAEEPPSAGSVETVRLAEAGDYAGALAAAERAVAAEPEDLGSWINCGVLAGHLERAERALQCFERALALREAARPEDGELLADVLSSRAALLARLGRTSEARADLARALWAGGSRWGRRDEARRRLEAFAEER